jgi:hypothetical protein
MRPRSSEARKVPLPFTRVEERTVGTAKRITKLAERTVEIAG